MDMEEEEVSGAGTGTKVLELDNLLEAVNPEAEARALSMSDLRMGEDAAFDEADNALGSFSGELDNEIVAVGPWEAEAEALVPGCACFVCSGDLSPWVRRVAAASQAAVSVGETDACCGGDSSCRRVISGLAGPVRLLLRLGTLDSRCLAARLTNSSPASARLERFSAEMVFVCPALAPVRI